MAFLKSRTDLVLPFWRGRSPFADTDGDGYPDHVDLAVVVSPDLKDPCVWAGVLNLVARIAFEVIAFQPPLVIARSSVPRDKPSLSILPPGRPTPSGRQPLLPAECWKSDDGTRYVLGTSGTAMMALLNTLAAKGIGAKPVLSEPRRCAREKTKGLAPLDLLDLANSACLYRRDESNLKLRRLHAALQIDGQTLSSQVGLSLCTFVSRMVLEATDLTLPMAFAGKVEGSRVVFRVRESANARVEIRRLGRRRGSAPCIQMQGNPETLALALTEWAQWAFLDGGPGFEKAETLRSSVTAFRHFLHHRRAARSRLHPQACPAPEPLRLLSKWKPEVRRVLELAASVPRGTGKISGKVFVSKPPNLRKRLKAGIEKLLRQKGYDPEIRVLNAYKPGLSWLMEEILPKLETFSSLHTLEVRYQPFAPAEKALEMKSRWLQELFPGPEVVARSLGLDPRRVRILRRAHQKAVYEIRAWTAKGRLLFKSGFSPVFTAFRYMPQEPKLGSVHPTTGGIRLRQGKTRILDKSLPTDREVFWRLFQEKWLPLLEEHMKRRIRKESFQGQIAFWEEIRLDVTIDETEERLGLGDERVCPMEALHEDLYFFLLDAFSSFSRRHQLPYTLNLGRVVPRVLSRTKGGVPWARLVAKPLAWGRAPAEPAGSRSGRSPVRLLAFEKGQWGFEFREAVPDALLEQSRHLGVNAVRCGKNKVRLWLKAEKLQDGARKARPLKEREPPLNRLLRAEEVSRWIERLGRFECIGLWQASHSLQGRPLWAVEAVLKQRDALTSLARLRLLKPTFVFNARHHANEVSGTNATLWMAWFLGATSLGREMLKQVNVAWIPLENPDGVATFEELLPYGRDHKLHAARYNALGVETYGEYFKKEPRFPEALAKARLWRRWLPDAMVDHHGVPSHEWEQPFSGYAPLRFREFWIPRSFVYALIPFVDEPRHAHHRASKALAALLGKAMSGVPEIIQRNREISSWYGRYARGPEPDTFPNSKGEPLPVLPPLGRTYRTNFAVRYPGVTLSEIILEVPDEGATGSQLALCAEAHLKAEAALLAACRRSKGHTEATLDTRTGWVRLRWVAGALSFKRGS